MQDAVDGGGSKPGHREGRTQATRIERATPQRTAERRLVAPAPMIAEVMVWVVEIGRLEDERRGVEDRGGRRTRRRTARPGRGG